MEIKLTNFLYSYRKHFLKFIMRVFIFLFCVTVFGFVPDNSFSQNKRILIDSDKSLSIVEVFDLITDQTDYNFIYVEDLFNKAPNIELKKGKIRTDKLLNKCLSETSFTYEFTNDKTIILKRVEEKSFKEDIQRLLIKGIIKDNNGDPLPGVTVLEKGTNRGVSSGFLGDYEIDVKDQNAILVFSFVGFTTQEVVVGSKKEINIVLEESIEKLEAIQIISTGYQKIAKEKMTGSAELIDESYFENSYKATLQEGLQGSVAGLQILSNNSHPQATPQVIIRGVGSAFQEGVGSVGFGAPTSVLGAPASLSPGSPLYVIDGVPTFDGSDLSSINGNDIKSISVLKDASATSIYGARAANGVIVVETKSGRLGEAKISYSTQVGFSEFTKLGDPLNTNDLQEIFIEGLINNTSNGITTEAEAMDFLLNPGGSTNPFNPNQNTDWVDELTRTAKMTQHNLSVSGGNEKNRYYFSIGYLKNETGLKEIDFNRSTVKLKYDTHLSEKLNFTTNLGYGNIKSANHESGSSFYSPYRNMFVMRPDLKIYNDDGTYNTGFNFGVNPLGILTDETRELETNNFRGAFNLDYNIVNRLNFETSISADYKLIENYNNFPEYIGKGLNNGSSFGIQKNTNILIWSMRSLLRYDFNLSKNQNLSAFVGVERSAIDTKITNVSVDELRSGAETLDNGITVDTYTKRNESSINSMFFNVDYDFNKKYLANLSFRRDGSSKFGENNKYGNYYALGLGWNLHNESFMENQDLFSFLKLRTSYGVNGNDQISSFAYSGIFGTSDSYNNGNASVITSAGNASIGWEENATFDIGVDFTLLNNRISGSIDYYTRETSELLYNLPVSALNGDTFVFRNFGGMNNSGVEISLNSRNIVSKDNGFRWNTTINFSSNKNKVTKLETDEVVSGNYIRKENEDFNTLNLYGYAGVDPDTGSELYYTDESEEETTTLINEAQKYSHGKTTPDFYGSMTNTFFYKNFSLTTQIYTSWGGQIFETAGYIQNDNGYQGLRDYSNTSRYVYENRWQQPGDITDVPKYVYGNARSQFNSSRWLHDASYIRLKKVELSYNFPKSLISKTFLSELRVHVSVDNIWTYIKDDTLTNDPEIGGITGGSSFNTPLEKTVYFGVNVSF